MKRDRGHLCLDPSSSASRLSSPEPPAADAQATSRSHHRVLHIEPSLTFNRSLDLPNQSRSPLSVCRRPDFISSLPLAAASFYFRPSPPFCQNRASSTIGDRCEPKPESHRAFTRSPNVSNRRAMRAQGPICTSRTRAVRTAEPPSTLESRAHLSRADQSISSFSQDASQFLPSSRAPDCLSVSFEHIKDKLVLGVPLGSPKTRYDLTGSQIAHVWERAGLRTEVEVRAKGSWRMTRSDHGKP
ncbi:hypothetical protein E6C27_scaffold67G006780 [Cucumis melo var. makuwa]|uniref:Uncharacterized protein n=1 Tax=Cucumis melo var. makuwa TaxID=1194695 RepID=A0A5A7TFI2_CUCMM|nr:hypothetical protein E6C27_scaffold67G006780 [Cucumis melo var. makuwa]